MSRQTASAGRVEPDGSLTIVLSGELDLAQAEDLTHLLTGALQQSPCLRLDLEHVTFLDCTTLGIFVRAGCRARAAGGWLRIATCRPNVQRLLALTQLEETFGLTG